MSKSINISGVEIRNILDCLNDLPPKDGETYLVLPSEKHGIATLNMKTATDYYKGKIECCSCGKVIAKGELPATVEIECRNCGAKNDLSKVPVDKTKPFAERLNLEKKEFKVENVVGGQVATVSLPDNSNQPKKI